MWYVIDWNMRGFGIYVKGMKLEYIWIYVEVILDSIWYLLYYLIFPFSSYGIRYHYDSIMHYASTASARTYNLKTMTANVNPDTNDPLMGQRKGLTQSDVDAINKLYCYPQSGQKNFFIPYFIPLMGELCLTTSSSHLIYSHSPNPVFLGPFVSYLPSPSPASGIPTSVFRFPDFLIFHSLLLN